MHHHHRRRKKRPNYNTRTVEVTRGYNGFGFTISGQQPCILSCIVANSPADQAGLKAGDFLISVNGINVSKLPHEAVVQAIGNSFGTIRLQIAENYFSDSSEEEISTSHINRVKPRYIQHRNKMNRLKNSPASQKTYLWKEESKLIIPSYSEINCLGQNDVDLSESQTKVEDNSDLIKSNSNKKNCEKYTESPKASTSKERTNLSPLTRKTVEYENDNICIENNNNAISPLEYRAIVGYMGTIEMPRQITTNTKLQTVRSCIRKLQREKRNPSTVLMTILPSCLTLKNSNNVILASYPASRLTYVTSSSEYENRFFGLVTSAVYTHNENEDEGAVGGLINIQNQQLQAKEVTISSSCHVFVIDTKICDHSVHERKAIEFQITCTKDPISNLCLEFPSNSEYVVNLIRSMYTMKTMPFPSRTFNIHHHSHGINGNSGKHFNQEPPANSPQPSNHSEVTTTSSNSDSGIGFHNDCANISDRILVVDFPNIMLNNRKIPVLSRPSGIFNNIVQCSSGSSSIQTSPEKFIFPTALSNNSQLQYKLNELSKRVDMRPDQKVLFAASVLSEALANASISAKNRTKSTKLLATKSCDDVLTSIERNETVTFEKKKQIQMSMDDISIMSNGRIKVQFQSPRSKRKTEDHVFLAPSKPIRRIRKNSYPEVNDNKMKYEKDHKIIQKNENKKKSDKIILSNHNINETDSSSNLSRKSAAGGGILKHSQDSFDIWSSLQDIKLAVADDKYKSNFIDGTFSEPDLLMSRALPSTNSSPFRRWGQSSFRATRTTPEQRPTINRRPSSLAASENDVYTKSMNDMVNDDINSVHSHSDGGEFQMGRAKALALNFLNAVSAQQNNATAIASSNSNNKISTNRVEIWGTSFEKLLEDPAGLETFAEFLKKEFSGENIYFWTACERYRHINDDNERAQKAIEIFSKHLGSGASEPVNVDSQARSKAQENLQTADRNLFNYAQKQIYNLMKFDSYQRFIRSDLYKKCQDAETKNQTLPYTGETLSDSLKTSSMLGSPIPSKLKKSASNAEDRRRKSLLPWHRKTRCKSRDRTNNNNDNDVANNNSEINPLSKSQSSSCTLKLPYTNSTSDIHSSRSSLSSFDANTCLTSNSNTAFNSGSEESKNNFCRVIFSDGATTVTLTRPDQSVRQLVERLLEKRGFKYQFFDVILSANGKALDLEASSNSLIGKEVQVEQRVAFKLDLPDPKVISVKSKPRKALCDVLKPILQKYNYRFEDVQVLIRDTHEKIELSLPVTAVDGQRLEVVILRNDNLWKQHQMYKRNGLLLHGEATIPVQTENHRQQQLDALHKNYLMTNKNCLLNVPTKHSQINQQNTLDEITNKVFNEVLQGKVESKDVNTTSKPVDLCSMRSDDCASESSSTYDRLRYREINGKPNHFIQPKNQFMIDSTNKFLLEKTPSSNKLALTQSNENLNINQNANSNNDNVMQNSCTNLSGVKKPLIAKWKTGVKLQVTARAHNQEEFLEGLKRAQRARLEDQRGTEINFELPDFLKDKSNLSAANKLRKIRENLNPITGRSSNIANNISSSKPISINDESSSVNRSSLDPSAERPQPAPRLSITKSASSIAISPNRTLIITNNNYNNNMSSSQKIDVPHSDAVYKNNNNSPDSSLADYDDISNDESNNATNGIRGPPPLPPKPKILPIKPSNWGQNSAIAINMNCTQLIDLTPIRRTLNNDVTSAKNAYLDQPSSSFV